MASGAKGRAFESRIARKNNNDNLIKSHENLEEGQEGVTTPVCAKRIPGILFSDVAMNPLAEEVLSRSNPPSRRKTVMIETSGDLEELLEVIQQILPGDASVTVSDMWSVPGIEQSGSGSVGEGDPRAISFLSDQHVSLIVPK